MSDWSSDIWATDKDASTRGADDATFQRVKTCNEKCAQHGVTENFIKVAFYSHVPLWTDDAAWEKFNSNFAEAARFARLTGCRGIALDIEYVAEQYHLNWEGYDYQTYSADDLHQAARKRGREAIEAMLAQYPDLVFLNLPESISMYGPLAVDFFNGLLAGLADANAPGGLHLLTEGTYDMTNSIGLIHYVQTLESKILRQLDEPTKRYWRDRCSVALGGWPLGYYRKIVDEQGNFLGYSGRKEKFGDDLVGSYADKSQRFPPAEFQNQVAGLLLGSKRYCWIYGHGATWWQFTEADVACYGKVSNSSLPVDQQLDEFKRITAEKRIPSGWIKTFSDEVKAGQTADALNMLRFVEYFNVIGPFGCKGCNNFETEFPPEKQIDFDATYAADSLKAHWETRTAEKESGYLDLRKHLQPSDWVCAYAFCKIISPRKMPAWIRLGTNDSGTLWFNGVRILSQNVERSARPDTDVLPVELNPGENTALIKVCNTELNWGLYLRISDEEGIPLTGISFWPEMQ